MSYKKGHIYTAYIKGTESEIWSGACINLQEAKNQVTLLASERFVQEEKDEIKYQHKVNGLNSFFTKRSLSMQMAQDDLKWAKQMKEKYHGILIGEIDIIIVEG